MTTHIQDDRKGEVEHDPALKIVTYYVSGAKGRNVVERDGQILERGYYARTIDGEVPLGPAKSRSEALSHAYEYRERIVKNANRGRKAKQPAVVAKAPAKKAKVKA